MWRRFESWDAAFRSGRGGAGIAGSSSGYGPLPRNSAFPLQLLNEAAVPEENVQALRHRVGGGRECLVGHDSAGHEVVEVLAGVDLLDRENADRTVVALALNAVGDAVALREDIDAEVAARARYSDVLVAAVSQQIGAVVLEVMSFQFVDEERDFAVFPAAENGDKAPQNEDDACAQNHI